jgi:putative transposase
MHIVQRGNNRARTFRDVADFQHFIACLRDACVTHDCAVHAYVVMSNHFHLLLTPTVASAPAQVMQSLGRTFGPWLNGRHERTGALWEGRFRSSVMDSDQYFFACSRYIELNPVRAGLAAAPEMYRWSSYCSNAMGFADALVTPHRLYNALAGDDERRASAYRGLFGEPVAIELLDVLRRALRTGRGVSHTERAA